MVRNIRFVSVVVPTYNERDNLPHLVAGIDHHLSVPYEVVVVDDGSPDGTAEVAEALGADYPVRVLRREGKLGLGSAYRAGFRIARGDAIFEMDADLSHDPRHMPGLLEAVERGAGVAVGSRYVHGGEVRGWGMYRKTVSAIGNGLARNLLGIGPRDCTSGFRCYAAEHRHLVTGTRSDGYAFQVEVLHLAHRLGVRVAEVPIIFENRTTGKSKLGAREFGKFLGTIGRLRVRPPAAVPAPVEAAPGLTAPIGRDASEESPDGASERPHHARSR